MATALLLTAVLLFVCIIVYKKTYRNAWSHLPAPGWLIPFIGHIQLLLETNDPINFAWDLYKKFSQKGMLYTKIFKFKTVIVGDYETLKYLFNHPDVQSRFSDNFHTDPLIKMSKEEREGLPGPMEGLISSQGSVWAEQRRFTLRTLRDFGFGKSGMEDMIQEEVTKFKGLLAKYEGEPVDLGGKFNLPILNALWRVTVGENFEYDDEFLVEIVKRITDWLQRVGRPEALILFSFPWIAKFWPSFLGRNEDIQVNRDMKKLMLKYIETHKRTLDTNEPRDYIDKFLIEVENTKDPNSSFNGATGIENLAANLLDLFVAGSETTSTTLTWAVLYMVRNPDVQMKVQKELDSIVGQSRVPSVQDKPNLPYTEAVLMEVQRCSNIIPDGVAHYTRKDVTVNGLTIPKDTFVQPLNAELLKGDYWGNGKSFYPERFLDTQGNAKKDPHLINFSIGKRQCLGETLAKVELFLFFAGLLQVFSFKEEVDGVLPSEDCMIGATVLPKPFKIRILKRKNV